MPLFVKQHLYKIIKKSCLIFREQDQSPKTNLRMFKFDKRLIWKNKNRNGNHLGAYDDVIRSLAKQNAFERNFRCYKKIFFIYL